MKKEFLFVNYQYLDLSTTTLDSLSLELIKQEHESKNLVKNYGITAVTKGYERLRFVKRGWFDRVYIAKTEGAIRLAETHKQGELMYVLDVDQSENSLAIVENFIKPLINHDYGISLILTSTKLLESSRSMI